MARIPPWLFPALGVGLVGLVVLEFRVLRLVVPIFARRVCEQRFAAFGQWLAFYLGLSLASHADLVTNGVFLARALFVDSDCTARSRFPDLWAHTMQTSALPMLAGVPFSAFVLLGWAFMALQFLKCLAWSCPRRSTDNEGRPVHHELDKRVAYYSTWGEETTRHAYVLREVAECCRMTAVVAAVTATGVAELDLMPQNIPKGYGKLLRASIGRIMWKFIFESAFQLNVQSSGLALAKAANNEHAIDYVTLTSIALGLAMAAWYFWLHLANANFYYRKIAATDIEAALNDFIRESYKCSEEDSRSLVKFIQLDKDAAVHIEELPVIKNNTQDRRRSIIANLHDYQDVHRSGLKEQRLVNRNYRNFLAVLAIYGGLVMRAVFKTAMVVYCEHGLHNIGTGCVCNPGFHSVGRTCVTDV